MNTAKVRSLVLHGVEGRMVSVTAESGAGDVWLEIRGLPDAAMRETRVRVRSALQQVGIEPTGIWVSVDGDRPVLSHTGSLDLAIALAAAAAVGAIPPESLQRLYPIGELSLQGALRPVRGILSMLDAIVNGCGRTAIVPEANGPEASHATWGPTVTARTLGEVLAHLRGGEQLPPARPGVVREGAMQRPDLSEIRGQRAAVRALEIAAAGGLPLLLIGPPGAGKTMLARRLPGILPAMSEDEARQVTCIHSAAGILSEDTGWIEHRPFRAPHHTVSEAGLVGGGDPPRPGEVTLAHNGVLFLDELTEFRRSTLDALGAALRQGFVQHRRRGEVTGFAARPLLVGAMNPCPCGWHGHIDGGRRCRCTDDQIRRYLSRVPRDLFALQVRLEPATVDELRDGPDGESSEVVRERVTRARAVRGALDSYDRNHPDYRVSTVARVIADLDGSAETLPEHIDEARGLVFGGE